MVTVMMMKMEIWNVQAGRNVKQRDMDVAQEMIQELDSESRILHIGSIAIFRGVDRDEDARHRCPPAPAKILTHKPKCRKFGGSSVTEDVINNTLSYLTLDFYDPQQYTAQ